MWYISCLDCIPALCYVYKNVDLNDVLFLLSSRCLHAHGTSGGSDALLSSVLITSHITTSLPLDVNVTCQSLYSVVMY